MIWKILAQTYIAMIWTSVLFAIATCEATSSSKWYRESSIDNKVSVSGHGFKARNLIRCADACASSNTCQSFFFLNGQPDNCVIHSLIFHTGSPELVDFPGSAYYIRENVQTTTTSFSATTATQTTTFMSLSTTEPTTTTPTPLTSSPAPTTTTTTPGTTTSKPSTTTPSKTPPTKPNAATAAIGVEYLSTAMAAIDVADLSTTMTGIEVADLSTATTAIEVADLSFSCPADDLVFRTAILNDNTFMTYRVFKTFKNQTDAAESCLNEGGFLARVTTTAKMNMLRTLASCPGYSTDSYYLDGSNAHSEPTWDSWIMANSELVPMSNDFWAIGKPSSPSTMHCLRMEALSGHMWEDCYCTTLLPYICEN